MITICIGSKKTGLMNCALEENSWIQSFLVSVTYIFPSKSTDIPSGPQNSSLLVAVDSTLCNECTIIGKLQQIQSYNIDHVHVTKRIYINTMWFQEFPVSSYIGPINSTRYSFFYYGITTTIFAFSSSGFPLSNECTIPSKFLAFEISNSYIQITS